MQGQPRRIRSFAQIPPGTPLARQAAWLYEYASLLAGHGAGHQGSTDDALAATLIMGIVAGLYPAIQAARLHPTLVLNTA
ncbi:hypothetical protein [Streptomyces exfoliatus]|uniref:hypothetical protein n=1 Tax=Streptomyces exfoliatus TaxID=1905 RepID=UPI0037B005B7